MKHVRYENFTTEKKNIFSVRDFLFALVFLLALPFKIIIDLLSYLFDFNLISPTIIAFPIACLALIFYSSKNYRRDRRFYNSVYFFLYFLLVSMLLQLGFSKYSTGFSEESINSVVTSLGLYLVYLAAGMAYQEKSRVVAISIVGAFLVSTIAILVSEFYLTKVWAKLNESGSYLRIADLYVILAFLLISNSETRIAKILILIISIPVLLYLGSRSSLLFYIFAIILAFFFHLARVQLGKMVIYALIAISAGVTLWALDASYLPLIERATEDNRITQTLASEGYGGVDGRAHLFRAGLERIYSQPFTGNWQFRLSKSSDNGGDYMHNALFMWDDFGIFIFGTLLILIFGISHKVLTVSRHTKFAGMLCFILLSMAFTRAYAFPYLFFLAGIIMTNSESNS